MSERVLVIDDSLPVHRLINSHLNEQGVECMSAYDGERGIELAAAERPGLILLDIDLPDTNGFEICSRLRSGARTARIPIIFLTADFNTTDKARGLELGAVDYITKPCNYAELTARVQAAIRERQHNDEHALRDALTGLWSKAYLDRHLTARLSQARRSAQSVSCIIVDIDNLTRINGQYGRGVGDDVICTIGNAIAKASSLNEIACAFKGGTFAILGFGSDRHEAARTALRYADIIEQEVAVHHQTDLGVTCCFGVADTAVASGQTLIDRAYTAMRRAKINGTGSHSVARPHRHRPHLAA